VKHADHVSLLRPAVTERRGQWADLGSGQGAFTLALADLLDKGGAIYSVDKDTGALALQEQAMRARFAHIAVHYIGADFRRRLPMPALDGIVMANSLHFVRDKQPVVELVASYLRPGGQIVLVEYNSDAGNLWVPYPLSFAAWRRLAERCGLTAPRLLGVVSSRFMGEIYAAQSTTSKDGNQ
jgi:SAM-dependent methyltransferase